MRLIKVLGRMNDAHQSFGESFVYTVLTDSFIRYFMRGISHMALVYEGVFLLCCLVVSVVFRKNSKSPLFDSSFVVIHVSSANSSTGFRFLQPVSVHESVG